MTVRDAVDELGSAQVFRLPRAETVGAGIREAVSFSLGGERTDEPATFLDVFDPEQVPTQVAQLAAVLAPNDAAVAVMACAPYALPLGPLVQALADNGLVVLTARGLPGRAGGTLLALSPDRTRPISAHLSASEVDPIASADRMRLEWALEGLALRSQVRDQQARIEALEATHATARQAMVAEHEKALSAQTSARAAAEKRAATAERQLAAATAPLSDKARAAADLLRADGVKGGRRIAKAVARRIK